MISEKQLEDWQRDIDLDPKGFLSWPLCLLAECITEIRRLRAENARLKQDKKDLTEEIDGPVTGYSGPEGSWSA